MNCDGQWEARCLEAPVERRVFLRRAALCFAALAMPVAASALQPRLAAADEWAYCTVSGVAGLSESSFATLGEAFWAIETCDPSLQDDESPTVSVVIHGALDVDVQEADAGVFEFHFPVDGASCILMGADSSASINAYDGSGAGRAFAISNPSGALTVYGLAFDGLVSLTSRDALAVGGCAFSSPVSCEGQGPLEISSTAFVAAAPVPQAAVSVRLAGEGGTLAFSGNWVESYAVGVACTALATQVEAHVSANTFALDGSTADSAALLPCSVMVDGGPWSAGSLAYIDNRRFSDEDTVSYMLVLGQGCSIASQDLDAPDQSVADDTLTSPAVLALFESAPTEEGPGLSVALTPECAGSSSDAEVVAASRALSGGVDAPHTVSVTISYDSNGATAGEAPEPSVVESGQAMTVPHMGSMVNAGYLFEGWGTSPDGSGSFYAAGQVILPDADMVLYAQWAPNGTVGTYDVTGVDVAPEVEAV